MDFAIEAMRPDDWDQVGAIYLDGIAARHATFETEVPSWERWDSSHHPFARLVARAEGGVLGWAALSPVSGRRCYAGVAEVSVYVSACHAGKGIGTALLRDVIGLAEKNGIWTLEGRIFPENRASLALVKKCGFREVGRRERLSQLDGVWRDVLLVERRSTVVGT